MVTLAARLLAQTSGRPAYARRAGFVVGIGAIVAISTQVSEPAWLVFPADYTVARIVLDLRPWLVASLSVAGRA